MFFPASVLSFFILWHCRFKANRSVYRSFIKQKQTKPRVRPREKSTVRLTGSALSRLVHRSSAVGTVTCGRVDADGYIIALPASENSQQPPKNTLKPPLCFVFFLIVAQILRWEGMRGVGGGAPEATVKPGSFLLLGPPVCRVTGRGRADQPAVELRGDRHSYGKVQPIHFPLQWNSCRHNITLCLLARLP